MISLICLCCIENLLDDEAALARDTASLTLSSGSTSTSVSASPSPSPAQSPPQSTTNAASVLTEAERKKIAKEERRKQFEAEIAAKKASGEIKKKPKLSKAERRKLQEQQKAAKQQKASTNQNAKKNKGDTKKKSPEANKAQHTASAPALQHCKRERELSIKLPVTHMYIVFLMIYMCVCVLQ